MEDINFFYSVSPGCTGGFICNASFGPLADWGWGNTPLGALIDCLGRLHARIG